jgi:hypothetical protein
LAASSNAKAPPGTFTSSSFERSGSFESATILRILPHRETKGNCKISIGYNMIKYDEAYNLDSVYAIYVDHEVGGD